MPARPNALIDFGQFRGMTITGPGSAAPPGTLRRAKGLHETCINELRPATGNTAIKANVGSTIHSIVRFADQRFYAVGNTLYEVTAGAVFSSADGSRLTLLRVPPGNTQPDQLFVLGGGTLYKVDAGLHVTNWGIEPPPDGFTAAIQAQLTKLIDEFNDHTSFTLVGTGATKADESTIQQFGNSIKVFVPAGITATLSKAVTVDLSLFSVAGDSSDEDQIEFWIRIDGTEGFDYCTVRLDIGAGDFSSDYYQYKILPTSVTPNKTIQGIGMNPDVSADEMDFISGGDGAESVDASGDTDGESPGGSSGIDGPGNDASTGPGDGTDAVASSATWTRIHIPKALFFKSGSSANTWANVVAIQLMFKVNDAADVTFYIDRMRMVGGAGMLGDYKYLHTFLNNTTGARSNSNPTPVQALQNDRQKVLIAAMPVSPDPQVTHVERWRTVGNGAMYFRAAKLANGTASDTDAVADYIGLNSNAGIHVLQAVELPTDNLKPDSTHIDAIYDQATVFWISGAAGKKGRVYYSPAGRPEAQKGFIDVSDDDQPLLRLLVWNRARYAWGEAHPYRLDGTEPYIPYKFDGVPGVLAAQARTVVSTPYGIIWQAKDGIRRFQSGNTSDLLHYDRIGPIFRNEALEGFASFQGIYACYARDQYLISDGTQGFAINLANGFIRDLGQGFTSMFYEEDTKTLLAGVGVNLVAFEEPGIMATAPCEWETAAIYSPPGITSYCQRIRIDADTGDQLMTPSLILDDTTIELPPFRLATRGFVEYGIGRSFLSLGVRLSITPIRNFKVFQVYADTYVG